MNKKDLFKKLALLETVQDQLLTELGAIDHLMRLIGFSDGLRTVKATAAEIYQRGYHIDDGEVS